MVAGRPSLDWLLKTRYSDHFEPLVGWEAGTCCRNNGMLQSLLSFTFFVPGVKSFVSIEIKLSPWGKLLQDAGFYLVLPFLVFLLQLLSNRT